MDEKTVRNQDIFPQCVVITVARMVDGGQDIKQVKRIRNGLKMRTQL